MELGFSTKRESIGSKGGTNDHAEKPLARVNAHRLDMFYKGQSIWDTSQNFEKNKGQSLAFSNCARDKNT